MKRTLPVAAAALLALPLMSGTAPASRGAQLPAFEAVKWYNTPPLAAADLQDKAVLVEVFRTW